MSIRGVIRGAMTVNVATTSVFIPAGAVISVNTGVAHLAAKIINLF